MPLKIKKQGDKFRIVEPSGKIAKNAAGTPTDGGGHKSQAAANKQIAAINISKNTRFE